ncbi:SDR family oxidoreductase [Aurantimonas sp. A2-1-M11]|uniref:SDR family oxidoreductase n=1 Tax=Aurantimonas sp. A2-1-M11 TaxID=3113712 RepID=UPI002F9461A5
MVEAVGQAPKVADAVAIGVEERVDVNAVDDGVFVPEIQHRASCGRDFDQRARGRSSSTIYGVPMDVGCRGSTLAMVAGLVQFRQLAAAGTLRKTLVGSLMPKVAVITGAGAGAGRAVALEFARNGYDVGLLARSRERLQDLAAEIEATGRRAVAVPTDVADAAAVDEAASRVETELGPIDTWVNVAMATVFSPVADLTAEEVRRATDVTYHGQVHGMLSALKRMRRHGRGTIVNIGSALGYRSVPLQAPYCAAKAAIRAFSDSLRSEIIHDGLDIRVVVCQLPAVNTPQFDWSLNKTPWRAQPVPPIFQPETVARAIFEAAESGTREAWIGHSSIRAILGNMVAPGLLDRFLARKGYSGQLTKEPRNPDAPANLFAPAPGHSSARGRFSSRASNRRLLVLTQSDRTAIKLGLATIGALGLAVILKTLRRSPADRKRLR